MASLTATRWLLWGSLGYDRRALYQMARRSPINFLKSCTRGPRSTPDNGLIWSVRSIWCVWSGQRNRTDETDQV